MFISSEVSSYFRIWRGVAVGEWLGASCRRASYSVIVLFLIVPTDVAT